MIAAFCTVTIENISGQLSFTATVKKPDGNVQTLNATQFFGTGEKTVDRMKFVMNTPRASFTTSLF